MTTIRSLFFKKTLKQHKHCTLVFNLLDINRHSPASLPDLSAASSITTNIICAECEMNPFSVSLTYIQHQKCHWNIQAEIKQKQKKDDPKRSNKKK